MYRPEHPQPNFEREDWLCLNGKWGFEFDDQNIGLKQRWEQGEHKFEKAIEVPFCFQSVLSGIADTTYHDVVWYKKDFTIPANWAGIGSGKRIILHFGAVDYYTKVFINGQMVGDHEGGHTSFSFDVTDYLRESNTVCLYVFDPSEDETIPRGKQAWFPVPNSIWYTRTTGIWQSVWLELVDDYRFDSVRITPDFDSLAVEFDFYLPKIKEGLQARVEVSYKGEPVAEDIVSVKSGRFARTYDLMKHKVFSSGHHGATMAWSPENPNLFDVSFTLLSDGQVLDSVRSYFGIRKIHTENGKVYLNNRPYYQKLLLDQGYWPEGLLTAPKDQDYVYDIEMSKKMGFNGCRKHQKIEDPRFLYWADKLGFIVWGEMPSGQVYSNDFAHRTMNEFFAEIERDYNHPCIVAWVPINESWGVPEINYDRRQQSFSAAIYHAIHAVDGTRLVISNDGWEMTFSDICAIHNYNHGTKDETKKYARFVQDLSSAEALLQSMPAERNIYAGSYAHRGEPIMLTEFGGISYKIGNTEGWGYTTAASEEEFLADYERVIDALYQSNALAGFCYTQTTDVELEINGMMTYDRKPKVAVEKIKAINDKYRS